MEKMHSSPRYHRPSPGIAFILTGHRGFTLIELVLTLLIVGILASIATLSYGKLEQKSDMDRAKSDIRSIESAIERFYTINQRYPEDLTELGGEYGTMLDPWGNPYAYLNLQLAKNKGMNRKDKNKNPINSDYDLYSMGADGATNSQLVAAKGRDDIVRANNGAFLGLGSDY